MSGEPAGRSGQDGSRGDGLEGERAYLLSEGTDYVTGWMQANDATLALRAALCAVGLGEAADLVRADVNVFGAGLVDLGTLPADAVAWIAYHLRGLSGVWATGRLPVAAAPVGVTWPEPVTGHRAWTRKDMCGRGRPVAG
jgi:hypothetical protein